MLLRRYPCVSADEPKTPAQRHLEEDEGRLDTRYKTSGPKLSDAIDTTLRRPDPELKDDWNLDDLALPGNMGSRKWHRRTKMSSLDANASANTPIYRTIKCIRATTMCSFLQVARRVVPPSQTWTS